MKCQRSLWNETKATRSRRRLRDCDVSEYIGSIREHTGKRRNPPEDDYARVTVMVCGECNCSADSLHIGNMRLEGDTNTHCQSVKDLLPTRYCNTLSI
ncbi:hypothetical protein J6590_048152 [Homalodisca vitripennis]|nr:hypothetical protein J6590_048152 [Homalodisca vitripennis]